MSSGVITPVSVVVAVVVVAGLPAIAPRLDGVDATVVGVARESGVPIVAGESDCKRGAV